MSRPCFLLLPLALFACGPDTTMDISTFDRSCTIAADCTLVFTTVCGCSCEEASIRESERDRYNDELAAKAESCEPKLTCTVCPDAHRAECLNKVCTVK